MSTQQFNDMSLHFPKVGQLVEGQTPEVVDQGLKLGLGIWWWGQIPSNQLYPQGTGLCRPHCPLSSDTIAP